MNFRELEKEAELTIGRRRTAYNKVFDRGNTYLEIVLDDLAHFCRAHDSTFHEDARVHAMLEGRREVWLRIQQYLNLTPDELWELYRRRK